MSKGALIVVVFALAIFWYIWRQIKQNLVHLDDQDINDFLAKRMEGKDLKNAREHLLRCPACKLRFDELTKQAQKAKPERLLKRRF
jgi:uncharacterized protein YlaI